MPRSGSGISGGGSGSGFGVLPWLGGALLGSAGTLMLLYLRGGEGRSPQASSFLSRRRRAGTVSTYHAAHGDQLSGTFLTDLLAALWERVALASAAKLRAAVEPAFAEALPGPLRSLRFTRVSMGGVPVRLDNVVVHDPRTNADGAECVEFELDVVWDGLMDGEHVCGLWRLTIGFCS